MSTFHASAAALLLLCSACGATSPRLPTYGPAPGATPVESVSAPTPAAVDATFVEEILQEVAPANDDVELEEPVVTYRLRRGETLDHFARWAELPVETVAHASALALDAQLPVGTEVGVPADQARRSRIELARDAHHTRRAEGYLASRGGAVGTEFYVVRTGDSAWTIAKLNGNLPVWLVESFNPSIDMERLRPGQALMLPVVADTIDAGLDAAYADEDSSLSMHVD